MTAPLNNFDERALKIARQNGEELAYFLLLFEYFLRETPEGIAVRREIEADWLRAVTGLRDQKKIIGSQFSLVSWLRELQKNYLSDTHHHKKEPPKKNRPSTTKKVLRFKNIP